MALNINVKDLIPHREPMLLVDHVVGFESEKSIHAQRTFEEDDPIFKGHFPGHPVLPGVLAIEALAQTGALLVNLSLQKKATETLFYFMSIDSSKFRSMILPGHTLDLKVSLIKRRGTVFRFKGEAIVEGRVATEVVFTAKLEEVRA